MGWLGGGWRDLQRETVGLTSEVHGLRYVLPQLIN